ncbi:MAG: archease [Chloroflexi bacterium]|nr:archease [Chloroflexota bacterium]
MDDEYPEFEEVAHTADLQIIAYGNSLEELFSNAVKGMYHVIGAVPGEAKNENVAIELKENDLESLLIGFLDELLFLADKGLATNNPKLNISLTELSGDIPLYSLLSIKTEIKAVTYHEMEILKDNEIFQTTITFDV